MATYPGAVKTFVDKIDLVDNVMAADVNDGYAEITAIETALGPNPYTIDDTITAGSAIANVGNYLDMVAYVLKQIKGSSTWYGASMQREVLTADRTYYVATTGSDTNTGLTAGAPFLTLQKSINTVAGIDIGIYNVTIQLADGTYSTSTGNVLKNVTGTGNASLTTAPVTITGNAATPDNVIITTTAGGATCFQANNVNVVYKIQNLKMTASGGTSTAIYAINGSSIRLQNVTFGTGFQYHMQALGNSNIIISGAYKIQGGATAHILCQDSGFFQASGSTEKITNDSGSAVAWSGAAAWATRLGDCVFSGLSGSGSFTGPYYVATMNSVISGSSVLTSLGNSAGATATGGQVA